jgi:glycosyltransferase involved in cell wall biosynthesis
MSILLSIAIPTYNRSEKLLLTLNNIVNQAKEIEVDKFEVIVSDNCSSDNTAHILDEWVASNVEISCKVNTNESNLGYDGNCHRAIELSAGKYVWLMADDDLLLDGGLHKVFTSLNVKQEFAFCFINYAVEVGREILGSGCSASNTEVLSADDMIRKTNLAFSFVSSCVFNKSIWSQLNTDQYYDTGWYNLYAARDSIIRGNSLLVGEQLIHQFGLNIRERRSEKNNSLINGLEFYIGAHLRFLALSSSMRQIGYSEMAINHVKQLGWDDNLRQIIYYKMTRDGYNFLEISRIIFDMWPYFQFKLAFFLVHIPVLLLPSSLVSTVYEAVLPIYKRIVSFRLGVATKD